MSTTPQYEQAQSLKEQRLDIFIGEVSSRIGKPNAISKHDLAMKIFGCATDTEFRAMRLMQDDEKSLAKCIVIAADGSGYFVADTQEEIDEYFRNIVNPRIASLARKEKILKDASRDKFHPQPMKQSVMAF